MTAHSSGISRETPLRKLPLSFVTLVLAGLVGLSVSTLAFAQGPADRVFAVAPQPKSPAATSPRLIPFIGEYQVWCTDRNPSNGFCSNHHGSPAIDIGMEIGTPLYAAGDGQVIEVETGCGTSWCRGGAGNFISIQHSDGRISRYLHLDDASVVEGQIVAGGDLIGTSGNTGQPTSPHLHYDEHQPAGTRVEFDEWLACVDGEIVSYPEAIGYSDWNDVPFHTLLRNDGYECFQDITQPPAPPILRSGFETAVLFLPEVFLSNATIEVAIERTNDGFLVTETRFAAPDTAQYVDLAPATGYSIKIRIRSGDTWSPWSAATTTVGTSEPLGPTCFGLYATNEDAVRNRVLIGTDDADVLSGTEHTDFLCGSGGPDTIQGLGGDDFLHGGRGGDTIHGGTGDDVIEGERGHDVLFGDSGQDTLIAGVGTDVLNGGAGKDNLRGGGGADEIRGAGGNDRILGGNGNDSIFGGSGHDLLNGSSGDDLLEGGAGFDKCVDPDWDLATNELTEEMSCERS